MFLGKVQATLPRNHIKYVGLQYIVKGTEETKRSHIIFTDAEWLRTDLEKSIFFLFFIILFIILYKLFGLFQEKVVL